MTGFIDPLEAAGGEPALDAPLAPIPAGEDPEVIARVRDLVLQAHREVVPELVGGSSLSELLASIEPAREAYANLAGRLATDTGPAPEAAATLAVPAGGSGPVPIDLDRMPTAEMLRRGIAQRSQARHPLSRP